MSIVKLRQEKNRQSLKKYILYALLAEVFFIPLSPTLATIALIIGIILTGWRFFIHRLLKVTPLQFDTPVIVFITISALSIFVSPDKFFSFYNFYNLVGVYALTYFLIGQNIETAEDLKQTMFALFAAFMLSVLYGYWQTIFGISVSDVKWVDGNAFPELKQRIFSTWENPNIFAGFLDMCIALLLGIYAKCKYNKEKVVCVLLMVMGTGALLFTYARGAMLALFILFAVYGFLKDRRLLIVCIFFAILAFAINPLVFERITSVFSVSDTSSEMRLAFWEATIAMIEDHPLLGIGWGAYFMVYPEYDFYMQGEKILIVHAHNIYLNYAAEIGILGALAFFWYFFGTMRLAFTAKFGDEEIIAEKDESDINDVKSEEAAEDIKILPFDEIRPSNGSEGLVDNKEAVEAVNNEKPIEDVENIKEKEEEKAEKSQTTHAEDKTEDEIIEPAGDTEETSVDNKRENIDVVKGNANEDDVVDKDTQAIEQDEVESSMAEDTEGAENSENTEEIAEESVGDETTVEEIAGNTAEANEDKTNVTVPKTGNITKIAEGTAAIEEFEENKFSFKEFLKEPFFEDRESFQRGVSCGIGLSFVTVALNGLTDNLLFNIPTSMFLWMLAAIAAKNVKIEK